MQSSKTPFFLILGGAVVVVLVMVVVAYLMSADTLSGVVPVQTTAIEVVVAPGLEPWAAAAAQQFNQDNPNTQVRMIAANGLAPTGQFQATGSTAPPAAWLAEATFALELAGREGYRFSEPQSVASSGLTWGGYSDKLAQFRQDYGELTWENINAKAASRDGFKLIMASPQNSAEGLGVLIAALAGHLGQNSISAAEVGQADRWLTDTLGNNNARPVAKPADTLASVQGRSISDAGLLAEASWRQVGLDARPDFSIEPLSPPVTLDYPLAIFAGDGVTPEMQDAARQFRAFLLTPAQQDALAAYGFEPANAAPATVQIDGDAAQRLLSWADRVLR